MGVNLCNPSSTQVYKVVELNHRKCSVCVCVCVCVQGCAAKSFITQMEVMYKVL